ncbi:MAG: YdiY family protein [Myxococcota bacterium]
MLPGGAEEAAGGAARSGGRAFDVDEVDWVRETPSYYRYDAELNVGAQSSSGNSDTTDLHFDALFEPTFGSNTLRFIGEFDRKEAEGNTTTDRWLASLAYERDIGRRWFVGATNIYEGDALRNLDLRIITTAGVGYRFYDEGPTRLSVQPGIAYVIENFEEQDDNTSYPAVRWKTDFTRDLYKHAITFFHNDQYLNNLQDLDDVTIETRTGIEFDLAWNLKMSAEFQSEWDNQPAEDADKTDTRWILKIGYEFGGDEEDWFH